ncbi:hypothetical protein SSX86_011691 [Deinandra increscens subsp. villosa]|uniref:F-box domain-containing protein n=1 Tax=Deinandra increscens subsp. villosa TaxID=3103831 RepID=A0AAP0D7B9_9ASTR
MGSDSGSGIRRSSFTDLPFEILSFIAIRLPLIELLSFRGTCKYFRSASSAATAKIESSRKPWLLFHRTNDSNCLLYNKLESKTYKRNIPDLDGAVCLASFQGWLLLFKTQQMYFFSPFSLSKITLPEFPHKELAGHVAAFSHVPTSPNCVVSVINPTDTNQFEIHVISKGQATWTPHVVSDHKLHLTKPTVTGATYDVETATFYYMYGESSVDSVLSFSVEDKKSRPYNILRPGEKRGKETKVLPYYYCEKMFHEAVGEKKTRQMEFEDVEDVCGVTLYENSSQRVVYLNEAGNADNSAEKTRAGKAVWIQPRFYEVTQDLHW